MPDIKTRGVVKDTIKAIDKSATAAQRMKDAYIRTKCKAENSVYSAEDSPSEYATNHISVGTATVSHEAGHQLQRQGQKAVSSVKENISKAKSHFKRKKAIDPLKKQYNSSSAKGAIKTVDHSKKGVKQAVRGTSKAARRSVKTAEKTAKTTIKTSQQAAKATQRTAQVAARASHRAAQTGVPMSAGILTLALFPSLQGVVRGLSGSRTEVCGRIGTTNPVLGISSSLIGMMNMGRTVIPTM